MIDWNASAKLNNCTVEWLKVYFSKYTGSGKRIIAICDICGGKRNVKFQGYHHLCIKCACNTPEAIEANRLRAIKQWSDPKSHETARLAQQKRFLDPIEHENASKRQTERWAKKSECDKQRDRLKQYYIDNPEAGAENSARQIQYGIDHPEKYDVMRGGNDIVGHHYIYDHSDLSKNIMKMTRSMHMRLHNLFRKYGIEIPHINTDT